MRPKELSWYWNEQVLYSGKIDVKRIELLYNFALYKYTQYNTIQNKNAVPSSGEVLQYRTIGWV